MNEIIPSILVKTKQEFFDKIRAVEGLVERVHLDIADGIFVPNQTIDGVEEVEAIETNLKIGVHLMVSKPENHVARWLETTVDRIIFHHEATSQATSVISAIRDHDADCEVGIALNPATPISAIEALVELVDFVHFMTVEPGFYGGKFVPAVVAKIKDFHYFYPDKPISVDGAITPDTAPQLLEAGASRLVVGSYIFEANDPGKAINELKKIVS